MTWIVKDTYLINETYKARVESLIRFSWSPIIWNRLSIPKARFICWMTAIQKVKTKDKLMLIGAVDNDHCPLCGIHPESSTRLFFECLFSKRCLQEIRTWSGLRFKPIAQMDFRKLKGNSIHRNILCAIFTSSVYYIWRARNDAVWHAFVRSPSYISTLVQNEVRHRVLSLHPELVDDELVTHGS